MGNLRHEFRTGQRLACLYDELNPDSPLSISSSDVYSADAVVLFCSHIDEVSQAPGSLKRFTTLTSGQEVLVVTVSLSDISTVNDQLSNNLDSVPEN